ncbi:hypothetical protein GQ457_05G013590 [Hibiscus cannabinus]
MVRFSLLHMAGKKYGMHEEKPKQVATIASLIKEYVRVKLTDHTKFIHCSSPLAVEWGIIYYLFFFLFVLDV